MDLGLNGRTAVVMGASQGLGEAAAKKLAEEGSYIIAVARRADALNTVKSDIEAAGGHADIVVCDLFDQSSRHDLCRMIKDLPRIDVLVANSGGPDPATALGIPSAIWTREFDAMVLGLIEIIDIAATKMKKAGFGRIMAVGSSGVVVPIPRLAVSNTLRSAVSGYMKTLAAQVAASGVTCNMILPGRIETPRTFAIDSAIAKAMGITSEKAREGSIATIPMGRYGKPEEFGSLVAFLASEQAAYITGSQIRIDGGAITSINT